MRKLSFDSGEILAEEQLKTVFGGHDNDQCPGGGIPCSCVGSDGSITVGCASSLEACWNFCD